MDEKDFQRFFEDFINELKKENPNIMEDELSSMKDAMKKAYVNNFVSIKGNNNTVINGIEKIDKLHMEVKNKPDFENFDIKLLTIRKFYKDKFKNGLKFKPIVNISALLAGAIIFLFVFITLYSIAKAGVVGFSTSEKPFISNKDFMNGYVLLGLSFIPIYIWFWYRNRANMYNALPNDIIYIEANYPETPIKKEVVEDLKKLRKKLKILGIF